MFLLDNGILQLEVDPQGAYINSFKSGNQDIFFPRTAIDYDGENKSRGGSHVCLPQFGAPGKFNLKSHGFGRDILWHSEFETKCVLSLSASTVSGEYENLESKLKFSLNGSVLEIVLSVVNTGKNPLALSPGLHHYYNVIGQETINIDGETIDITDVKYADSIYVDSPNTVKTEFFELEINYENLPISVLWTDKRAAYFCIEPTYNSISFSKGEGYLVLGVGESAEFRYSVAVTLK